MIFKVSNDQINGLSGVFKYIFGFEGYSYFECEDEQSVGESIQYEQLPKEFFDCLEEHKKELKAKVLDLAKGVDYKMINVNDKGWIESELCLYYLSNKTSFRSIIKIYAIDKNYDIIEISTDIDELKTSFNKTVEANQEKLSVINSKLKDIQSLKYIYQSDSELSMLLGL